MISETFKPDSSNAICFTFWFHALGSTVGALRIFKADENVTNSIQMWEIIGKQSSSATDWKRGVVPITNIVDDYTIIIEGQVGKQISYGDIR